MLECLIPKLQVWPFTIFDDFFFFNQINFLNGSYETNSLNVFIPFFIKWINFTFKHYGEELFFYSIILKSMFKPSLN